MPSTMARKYVETLISQFADLFFIRNYANQTSGLFFKSICKISVLTA